MVLQNEYMLVEIAEMGAELMRIFDRKAESELLWNGDPAYWKRRSPVLFPNVGKTYGNKMKINGEIYPTSQHGFARDCEFICEAADDTHASYLLKSDAQTRARYPFDFELRISYALEDAALEEKWNVKNTSDKDMPFTIGGHPAFSFVPGETKTDYVLHFPEKDELEYILLDLASGTALPQERRKLELADQKLDLCDKLFACDALILDGCQVEEVWLCHKDGRRRVGMECKGFPNYGIWSVQGAPFVCLEPWMGRCDNCGFEAEVSQKPNVNIVAPGCSFEKSYRILLP